MTTLIWGKDPNNNGKLIKKSKEIVFKEEFNDLVCNQSIIVGITKNNEIYKKGNFKFEKNNIDEFKLLKFPDTFYRVEKIEIGSNHCVFLMSNSEIYSMGDNYYGQLGLDNYHLPMISEPRKLNIFGIKSITVYKDSNFAIDKNNKLFAWGANRYLGINSKSNLFKPKQIYLNLKISKIFVSNNKIVINTMKDKPLVKEETEIIENKTKQDQDININTNPNPVVLKEIKTERSELLSKEKNDFNKVKTINSFKQSNTIKTSELVNETLNDVKILLGFVNDFKKFESKINEPIIKYIPMINK